MLIPARLESTRLASKLLADIGGFPALYYSWRAATASGAERVVIAAGGDELATAARAFGAEVCVTDPALPSGTDRCLQACEQLALDDDQAVVNLQGDELLMEPANIDAVAGLLDEGDSDIATLAQPLPGAEAHLPERVKVVCDDAGKALYFSRAAIPWDATRNAISADARHHLGIYAYRVSSLRRFAQLAPAPLERLERLEQLRALAAGMRIRVGDAPVPVQPGLDTAEDLQRIRAILG